ncbi:MAG TPA: hypothetical protein DCS85_04510, partial [Verrucomicrobiales bacterium]|nr:hypothetical protein [Verrucomicrobiales bacterium]
PARKKHNQNERGPKFREHGESPSRTGQQEHELQSLTTIITIPCRPEHLLRKDFLTPHQHGCLPSVPNILRALSPALWTFDFPTCAL